MMVDTTLQSLANAEVMSAEWEGANHQPALDEFPERKPGTADFRIHKPVDSDPGTFPADEPGKQAPCICRAPEDSLRIAMDVPDQEIAGKIQHVREQFPEIVGVVIRRRRLLRDQQWHGVLPVSCTAECV